MASTLGVVLSRALRSRAAPLRTPAAVELAPQPAVFVVDPAEPQRAGGEGDGTALVVGGSGRVGGSTARWLHKLSRQDGGQPLSVVLGGRSKAAFEEAQQRLKIDGLSFVPVDLDGGDAGLLEAVRPTPATKQVIEVGGKSA